MSAARFFLDEDIYGSIVHSLRKLGHDALSTAEAGRKGESDESQLAFAAAEARVLVTFNVGHFTLLHATWITQGRHHAGIAVSRQCQLGELLRRLNAVAQAFDSEAMRD